MNDPFEMLGVDRRFDLDLAVLERTHRELSRALHPDKYARAGASERRAVLDKAASVNEAWRTLRDPIRRAETLFTLAGIDVGEDREPKPTPALLMDVLEQREALADARAASDLVRVHAIGLAMGARARETEAKLATGFASVRQAPASAARAPADHGPPPAAATLRELVPLLGELRFYKRFLDEVSAIEEEND